MSAAPVDQVCEIFFAADNNTIEAVVLPRAGDRNPNPNHLFVAMRLVGSSAIVPPDLGEMWNATVVCSRDFAKTHRNTSGNGRPDGVIMGFLAKPSA